MSDQVNEADVLALAMMIAFPHQHDKSSLEAAWAGAGNHEWYLKSARFVLESMRSRWEDMEKKARGGGRVTVQFEYEPGGG